MSMIDVILSDDVREDFRTSPALHTDQTLAQLIFLNLPYMANFYVCWIVYSQRYDGASQVIEHG